jgi:hypothetical protein
VYLTYYVPSIIQQANFLRVVGNGGHQVDPRLGVGQNPYVLENRSRDKWNRGGDRDINKQTHRLQV